jgi:tryptophanyl-tRNA synthetase
MSASVSSSSIFCDDSMEVIEKKIMEGAQCENVDTSDDTKVTNNVVFTYLTFYMEDDQMLDKIKADYSAKLISKMELKKILVTVLQEFFLNFQQKRKTVTDELVEQFMTVREMKFD